MKKILLIAMALSALGMVLAGCGAKEEAPADSGAASSAAPEGS